MIIEKKKISDLIPAPYNPRQSTAKQEKHLKESLEKFGLVEPIIFNKQTGYIVGGHFRVRELKKLGIKEIECVIVDLNEADEKELNIRLNANTGSWDWDTLANDWEVVDLEAWGLDIPQFDTVEELEASDDDYDVPEGGIETDIVIGDLFEIGEHRLLCGDSTDSDAVERLMNGEEPYLMVTDPPYGVVYDANWRNERTREDGSKIGASALGKVQNDDNADWTKAWALSPSKVAYVYHASFFSGTVQKSLQDCDFVIRSQIIWVKSNFTISRSDYHWKHEPCWYAVKKGSKGNWASDRKQTTVWEIAKQQKNETGHSTQKPIECMSKPILNHDGDIYDPFLGSGSTMVAAHQLKRKCYGMELDCKYVEVIVNRMIKLDKTLTIKRNGVDETQKWLDKLV